MSTIIIMILLLTLVTALLGAVVALTQKQKEKTQHPTISDTGIREMLSKGEDDEARYIYQKFTGVDIFSAKQAIAVIKEDVRFGDARHEAERLLRLGEKAAAIESYQQSTGASLKEALEIIEALERKI